MNLTKRVWPPLGDDKQLEASTSYATLDSILCKSSGFDAKMRWTGGGGEGRGGSHQCRDQGCFTQP